MRTNPIDLPQLISTYLKSLLLLVWSIIVGDNARAWVAMTNHTVTIRLSWNDFLDKDCQKSKHYNNCRIIWQCWNIRGCKAPRRQWVKLKCRVKVSLMIHPLLTDRVPVHLPILGSFVLIFINCFGIGNVWKFQVYKMKIHLKWSCWVPMELLSANGAAECQWSCWVRMVAGLR